MKNRNLFSAICLFLFTIGSLRSQVDTIRIRKMNCMTINGKSWVYGSDSTIVVEKQLLLGKTKEQVKSLLGESRSFGSYYTNGDNKEVWDYYTNTCETGDYLYRWVKIEFKSGKVIKARVER